MQRKRINLKQSDHTYPGHIPQLLWPSPYFFQPDFVIQLNIGQGHSSRILHSEWDDSQPYCKTSLM